MFRQKYMIEKMLTPIGITINGNSPWDIRVRDDRTFPQMLQNKNLGLGESYMEGWWDCQQLDEFICNPIGWLLMIAAQNAAG